MKINKKTAYLASKAKAREQMKKMLASQYSIHFMEDPEEADLLIFTRPIDLEEDHLMHAYAEGHEVILTSEEELLEYGRCVELDRALDLEKRITEDALEYGMELE